MEMGKSVKRDCQSFNKVAQGLNKQQKCGDDNVVSIFILKF